MASITNQELISFVMGIKTKFGIDLSNYSKKYFEKNINSIQKKYDLNSMFKIWGKVLKEKKFAEQFLAELLDNSTSFFLDPPTWEYLNKYIVTECKNKTTINTWHASCSTGEETYSMAILLKELKLLSQNLLIATDINNFSIKKAQVGCFSGEQQQQGLTNYSSCNLGGNFLNYFREDTIDEELIDHIIFRKDDLSTSKIEGKFDIIFCRNVLLGFNEDLKIKVLNLFHSKLEKGGLLVLGGTEKIPFESSHKFSLFKGSECIYKKI